MGLDDLVALANGNIELLSELADVTRELHSGLADFDADVDLSPAAQLVSLSDFSLPSSSKPAPQSLPNQGATLAEDLQAIDTGKGHEQTLPSGLSGVNWSLFEKVGQESLQYVFEHELGNWQAQRKVGGETKRLDVMAKVIGDDVFSRTLIEDFRSRHLLFEFKNYGDPIGANLVHITEKYLFPTALRSTVVFVSPHGLSAPAQEAARGALRDAGKLMLDLPVALLCTMLEEKDRGIGAGARMEELLDRFLLSLGR